MVEKNLPRRNLLKGAGIAAAGTVGLYLAHRYGLNLNLETLDNDPGSSGLKRLFEQNARYGGDTRKSADSFMGIEVPSKDGENERTRLEARLFASLQEKNASAADIIYALNSAGTIEGRGWGMQLLWQKRQKGELSFNGIAPLDKKRIEWAYENDVDARTLAIARDVLKASAELLIAGKGNFFEAVPEKERGKLTFLDKLPNPGLVAKLLMTETGSQNLYTSSKINRNWGHVYIGDAPAWLEISTNRDWYPKGREHLEKIAEKLEKQTGLPYLKYVKKIPGSQRGDPESNGSGGAIGPQFMPLNALLFMEWYEIANKKLGNKYPPPNPFNPFTGTVMVNLYLASEFYGRHPDTNDKLEIIRPGYSTSGTHEEKIAALRKWNPSDQPEIALAAGYDYFENFERN